MRKVGKSKWKKLTLEDATLRGLPTDNLMKLVFKYLQKKYNAKEIDIEVLDDIRLKLNEIENIFMNMTRKT